jgi:hypothetical protein
MTAKRELIEPHKGDKRYVRRNAKGRFKESDDVGRRAVDRYLELCALWSLDGHAMLETFTG